MLTAAWIGQLARSRRKKVSFLGEIPMILSNAARGAQAVAASLVVVTGLAGTAVADEAWTTEWGVVEYYDEIGSIAVFSVDDGLLFIDGLAGNFTNRGAYSGYWVTSDTSDGTCAQPAYDEYGGEYWVWGYVSISFIDPAFPSRWQASLTACDGPVVATINASPM